MQIICCVIPFISPPLGLGEKMALAIAPRHQRYNCLPFKSPSSLIAVTASVHKSLSTRLPCLYNIQLHASSLFICSQILLTGTEIKYDEGSSLLIGTFNSRVQAEDVVHIS